MLPVPLLKAVRRERAIDMIDQPPPFICQVVKVHDGDGPLWCANGIKVRTAGVQAPDYEDAAPCRAKKPGYVCDDRLAAQSQRIVERLTLRQRLTCKREDRSWKRVVATCAFNDGRDLRCETLRLGAAVPWPYYVRAYRLPPCP